MGQCGKLVIAFDPVGGVDVQCPLPISNVVEQRREKDPGPHAGFKKINSWSGMIAQGETGDFAGFRKWGGTLFSGISLVIGAKLF